MADAARPHRSVAVWPDAWRWLAPLLLAALAAVAYRRSLAGVFILDDYAHIIHNPHLRRLWPPEWLHSSRPIVAASLAMNYALSGLAPWSYHVVNLLIHWAAAWALWDVVRRTLRRPVLGGRFDGAADGLALAIASLWLAHPLHTASVTYIIQRAEALAGLWTLLALAALIRTDGPAARRWTWTCVACCALAMLTKPTAVTAPIALLAYARLFLPSESPARRALWIALPAMWLALAGVLALAPEEFRGTAGPTLAVVPWWRYLLTQPGVLLHYLRLSVWPAGMVLDEAWPWATIVDAALPALLVGGALAATVIGVRRRRPAAFLGAWIALTLAPSSSLVPMADAAFAHRMYLPLAGVIAAMVLAGWTSLARVGVRRGSIGAAAVVGLVAVLAARTDARNALFRSEAAVWRDTLARRPHNARAHGLLAVALAESGRVDEALPHLREALRREPHQADWHYDMGLILARGGRAAEAEAWWSQALALRPDDAQLLRDVAMASARAIQPTRAVRLLREALTRDPSDQPARYTLATLLAAAGDLDDALAEYRTLLARNPRHAPALNNAGVLLARTGRLHEAIDHFDRAVRLDQHDEVARDNLHALRGRLGLPPGR
jgi:Flp pilus assembly protein TadD